MNKTRSDKVNEILFNDSMNDISIYNLTLNSLFNNVHFKYTFAISKNNMLQYNQFVYNNSTIFVITD